jgi:hypothetical protein
MEKTTEDLRSSRRNCLLIKCNTMVGVSGRDVCNKNKVKKPEAGQMTDGRNPAIKKIA